ncbi:hypothetical protein ACQP00_32725 [Dactylosporangium sp. CS-047395]|uniref:hypothetical protein n=1 Tax=Dactylosporangium sp. CS-047395 TaxID=3239936 RepID=UPI003D909768
MDDDNEPDFGSYDPGADHLRAFDDGPEPQFGSGGYHGDYNGVPGCWYSSDGYVYAPDGSRIGAA